MAKKIKVPINDPEDGKQVVEIEEDLLTKQQKELAKERED